MGARPSEIVVFRGERVRMGRFRARPTDAWFRQLTPAGGWLVVFPRLPVRITHAGRGGVVADPTVVMLYNRDQEYARDAVSPDGDACEYFSFSPDDIVDAVRAHDASVVDRPLAPFAHTHGPGDPRAYAKQRVVVELAARGRVDALAAEEAALDLLRGVVSQAYREHAARARSSSSRERATRTHVELADACKTTLATRFDRKTTVGDVARAVGASPFHVCRVFRAKTGHTLHAYVDALRLHAALDRLPDGRRDLTALALDVGYSSHSHFTAAFRRRFGVPPSEMRAATLRAEKVALSKILTA